jgi:hypothetical protein
MMIVFPRSSNSTSSARPACSITAFGSRTPRELPIRTSRVVRSHAKSALVSACGGGNG